MKQFIAQISVAVVLGLLLGRFRNNVEQPDPRWVEEYQVAKSLAQKIFRAHSIEEIEKFSPPQPWTVRAAHPKRSFVRGGS